MIKSKTRMINFSIYNRNFFQSENWLKRSLKKVNLNDDQMDRDNQQEGNHEEGNLLEGIHLGVGIHLGEGNLPVGIHQRADIRQEEDNQLVDILVEDIPEEDNHGADMIHARSVQLQNQQDSRTILCQLSHHACLFHLPFCFNLKLILQIFKKTNYKAKSIRKIGVNREKEKLYTLNETQNRS